MSGCAGPNVPAGSKALVAAPRLSHLAVGTPNVARLADFYRELFQVEELARHQRTDGSLRSVWFDLSGVTLMIEQSEQAPLRVEGSGAGLFLLAFHVADSALRAVFEERMALLGAAVEFRTRQTSYGRDPDGNRFAVSEFGSSP